MPAYVRMRLAPPGEELISMCGIAGVVRTGDRALPPPGVTRRMMAAIEHRGPDDSGEYRNAYVHLGAHRLAILDLKGGHQPIYGCSADLVAICNGEIYNFQELRQELRSHGHHLRTECDTEVVAHVCEDSGSAGVTRLRGMFAFAVWDDKRSELTIARDRLGIKPLFWHRTADYLLFASEIKGLLASGLVPSEIDPNSVDDLFSLSYPCPPRTMFRNVFEVRPAHVLTVRPRSGSINEKRYWSPPFSRLGEHPNVSAPQAAAELRELLRAAIYRHLQSDVPTACYLSGGLDSSAVAALVRDVTGDPPRTFSIGFDSPSHDETPQAKEMAAFLQSTHDAVVCGKETAERFEEMIWAMEFPLQFPLALPMLELSNRVAASGYRVVLTGEGADELLAGYDCFRGDKLRRVFQRPYLKPMRRAAYSRLYRWLGTPQGTVDGLIANHERSATIASAFGGLYPPWFDVWTTLDLDRTQLLSRSDHTARPIEQPPAEFQDLLHPHLGELHPLDAGLALELTTRLPSWILPIGDRSAMANGVETRVPLLDDAVVEYVCPLSPDLKLRGFREKAILRDATRPLLPPRTARLRKRPFYTPLAEWFFLHPRPDFVHHHLSRTRLESVGVFEPAVVQRLLDAIQTTPQHHLLFKKLEWILILVLGTQVLHERFRATQLA